MPIVNGYSTLAEFKALLVSQNLPANATDDTVIEDLITDASRLIDNIANRTFYLRTETHYFDQPAGRQIMLDDDLLAVTTLTNGNSTVIAAANYILLERGRLPYWGLRLKEYSTVAWAPDSSGNTEQVVSLLGSWGYVDRAASDAESVRIVSLTHRACLDIALMKYRERTGQNIGGAVQITAAGLVITPQGAIPKSARDALDGLVRLEFA